MKSLPKVLFDDLRKIDVGRVYRKI